jgi:hypothetical protein
MGEKFGTSNSSQKQKQNKKTPPRESNWPISLTSSQDLYFDFQVNPNTIPFKNGMPAGQK